MAEVNYTSPSSLLPNTGPMQVPSFLQGMQYNTQMGDYKRTQQLSELMSQLSAMKQSEEFTQGAPVRQSQRLSDIATNQATAGTIGQLKTGQAQLAGAQGAEAQALLPSNIAVKAADNALKLGEVGIKQAMQAAQYGELLGRLQGPQAASQAEAIGKQMGLPADIIRAGMSDPARVSKILLDTNQALQAKILEEREKEKLAQEGRMALEGKRGENSARVANITAAAMRDRAAATGGKRSTDQLLADVTQQILAYQQKGQPVPPELIAMAQSLREQRIAERTAGARQGQEGTEAMTGIPAAGMVPAAPIPGSAPAAPNLQMEAIKAWGDYSPNKYEYRMGPNGRLQRKAK